VQTNRRTNRGEHAWFLSSTFHSIKFASVVPLVFTNRNRRLHYTESLMIKSRKLLISVLLLIAIGLGGWFAWTRFQRPPEATRLLPEGDLVLYADLRPLHLWDLSKSRPVQLDPDYQEFVDQTGIQFERDLDQVAMSRRGTDDHRDVESAEVFAGRFESAKLNSYLLKSSSENEKYDGVIVYVITHAGHTVRVCVLDKTKIAVTNMASADPIHGMIDRFHHGSGEPSLVKDYYHHVPAASLAWVINRMPSEADVPQLPGGLSFGFLENTVAVASLRYAGDLLLRADVFAQDENAAARIVESAKTLFAVYRTVSQTLGARGNDPDIKAALDSIRVEQDGKAAVFTAAFSQRFVKKIVADAGPEVFSATPTPANTPTPAPIPRRRR
jgi:hypothetical protein